MQIIEQALRITTRTQLIKTNHPAEYLFQVFVNGRLQNNGTYNIDGDTIDFGFDCLVSGDFVQLFYFVS
ncbi:MAG: hypothetical protein LLG02_07300 [Pelosinus sp.]|nr:hypothetical protein [Pelosinus sp.]